MADQALLDKFVEAMDDDFNTPDALAVVFEALKEGNRRLDEGQEAESVVAAFSVMTGVLGLELETGGGDDLLAVVVPFAGQFGISGDSVEGIMDDLLTLRARARDERDWSTADAIRDGFAEIGVVVEDTVDGARWHRG